MFYGFIGNISWMYRVHSGSISFIRINRYLQGCIGLNGIVAEFISPKTVYTFSSIGDDRNPKSVKCTHSATQNGT